MIYTIYVLTFLGAVYFIAEFIRFYRKHIFLQNEINKDLITIEEENFSNNLIETDYQNLLLKLYNQSKRLLDDREQLNREQSDYFNLWVHEIKTPIFVLDLLVQNKIKDTDTILKFKQELFKIEQYTEMVLQYLRIESLTKDFKFQQYSLYKIVKNAVKKYSIIFINKDIELKLLEFETTVLTDEKWFSFILEQVLSNSLKYTKEGRISIEFDAYLNELRISDTGIGIASEDLERIFEKSFTGYNGRSDRTSTGMGLYLCKKVACALNIEISAESALRQGTTIKLRFDKYKV
ncbi:HAMP domain-containing histidine kinase [Clostridium sp. P21]|uniref:histidine kinase n=1 Tax=Clostridium muellerianum TaxID=2716538 RepID=A0A7Y0HN33_9CLOT|nr:HAMP domain-containing histidine kinase [Clostridium muellerianum]